MPVKFKNEAETEIEGLLLPYGGPFGGLDLYKEKFTPETDFCLSWSKGGDLPLLWHHGLDPDVETEVVGRIKKIDMRDSGGWMQAVLDTAAKYHAEIKELIKKGALGLSSGAMAHLVSVDTKTGIIRKWPVVEGSLTPTPANPYAIVNMKTAEVHYKSAGLELPATVATSGFLQVDGAPATIESVTTTNATVDTYTHAKAQLDASARDQLGDADFAYIDSDGGRHLPINDAAHARAAMARFNQTQFESEAAKAKARKKIVAACQQFGIEVSEDSMPLKTADATPVASRGQGFSYTYDTKAVNEEAFWGHVEKGEDDNAHWLWTGAKNTKGYGILEVDGQTVRAHRVAWELAHGAIPDGKDVGHKTECATTSCVRASHLELVTNEENAAERANRESGKAVTMEQMRQLAADLSMDMTDADMQKMVDAFPNHDEAAMRKALAARKKMGKSAPDGVNAVSWQDIGREVQKALEERMEMSNPFDSPGCVCIEETYSDHIIACVWMKGDERYFSVPFTLGEDGHVATVGLAEEMEETYIPMKPAQPVATMAWVAARYAADLAECTKGLAQRRLKEGRMISDSNRKRLMSCMEQMMAACSEMQSLLDSSAPQPAKAAALRRQADLLTLWAATLPQN